MNEGRDGLQENIGAVFRKIVAEEGDGLIAGLLEKIFELMSLALENRMQRRKEA